MSKPSLTAQEVLESDPVLVWTDRFCDLVERQRAATDKVNELWNLKDEHRDETGADPNFFTRCFFGLASLLHQSVPCSDEVEIWEAIRLHEQLRMAKKHEARCVRVIARHIKQHPRHLAR